MAQRAACVIGWPVEHSRSPLIHNYWIRQHGLDAEYRREAVRPEEFAGFVARLAERGYVGANVTLPHKEAALAASQPDDRARAVGAANTLWLEGERLHSTNTDVEGFHRQSRRLGCRLGSRPRNCDRARRRRWRLCGRVRIDRTRRRAHRSRQPQHGARAGILCRAARLAGARRALGEPRGAPAARRIARQHHIPGHEGTRRAGSRCDELPEDAVVADIVYVPLRTRLLEAAQARGLRTADGLGMLLHQAVRGFSLWFGVQPAVTAELRALVEADLVRN